jgi:hypothetical protein
MSSEMFRSVHIKDVGEICPYGKAGFALQKLVYTKRHEG